MRIATVRRYPVKSMLGEELPESGFGPAGLDGDRVLALVDAVTGLVATAKHPRLWRALLQFSASLTAGAIVITRPGGATLAADDPRVDAVLTEALGRRVQLSSQRPPLAGVERPDPEDVLEHGLDAVVPAPTLQIGQGTPGATFVDYAPVHLITTATVDRVGGDLARFRPNLVLDTADEGVAFEENDWVGRRLQIGGSDGVLLLLTIPTPRCAVPTLEHGRLPRQPAAVRTPMTQNRIDVPGFGVLPCAGVYAQVLRSGVVRAGDVARLV